MPNNKTRGGFTLLEVLVALFLFTIMSTIAFSGLNTVLKTNDRINMERSELKNLTFFFSRLKRDLRGVVNRPSRGIKSVAPAFTGGADDESNEYRLVFTTMGSRLESGWAGAIRRIGYSFNQNKVDLMIWPAIDGAESVEPEIYTALDHVENFAVEYLDHSGAWRANWGDPLLPAAVKVEVALKSVGVVSRVFALN